MRKDEIGEMSFGSFGTEGVGNSILDLRIMWTGPLARRLVKCSFPTLILTSGEAETPAISEMDEENNPKVNEDKQ